MTWVASRLKERVQIKRHVLTPASTGSLDRTYETLLTVWAEIKPISPHISQTGQYRTSYVKGEQTIEDTTHKVIIRRSAVNSLGKAFSSGFSSGFDSIPDINPIKSELFLFMQRGSTSKGRLFRVVNIENVKERRELMALRVMEIEEQGTGASV